VTQSAPVPQKLLAFLSPRPGQVRHVSVSGGSMQPTLRYGELVEVAPYGEQPARVGDVVLFRAPQASRDLLHRVVAIAAAGIRTRGDSNTGDDPWELQPSDIMGRVTAVWRRQRRRTVACGWLGRMAGRWMRWRRVLAPRLNRMVHPLYLKMAGSRALKQLVPPRLRPRVVAFGTGAKRRLQVLMGQRIVGWFDPVAGGWHIERPFRLFVDEAKLPKGRERNSFSTA